MNTKFFTGDGDQGESKMGKEKISKSDLVFDVLGGLDELNSWIGFSKVEVQSFNAIQDSNKVNADVNIENILKSIQEMLFIAQAEITAIAMDIQNNSKKITIQKTEILENIIKKIDDELPVLTKFIITGGSELSARLDIARAVTRKVEKSAVRLSKEKELTPEFLKFLNRLSSVLFALARYANFKLGIKEENPSY